MTPEQWKEHDERVRAGKAKEEAIEDRKRRDQVAAQLIELGVPQKDIVAIAAGTLQDNRPMRLVQEFDQRSASLLVMAGVPGCGKTTAAGWWLATSERVVATYLTLTRPCFITVARLQRLSRYNDEQMQRIEKAKRLVIDDLGAEYVDEKGSFQATVDALVNARYEHVLPTIITTNLTADAFKERYGARVADRIRELGRFVSINATSYRIKETR
jgi:DNA replication protein DnaC